MGPAEYRRDSQFYAEKIVQEDVFKELNTPDPLARKAFDQLPGTGKIRRKNNSKKKKRK